MRNQFRSSFRGTARALARTIARIVAADAAVRARGQRVRDARKATAITEAYCHVRACLCACVRACARVCVVTLNFGGSVVPLSPLTLLGLGRGPPPAGTAF